MSSYYTTGQCGFPTDFAIHPTGRYVRAQLAGTNYLSLAEVQILGPTAPVNVALNKTATQSSTHSSGAVASRAVDGNTSGVFANGSVTHTNSDLNAWWQVDLGQVETIGTLKVWNRVEFPERLSNFYVFVSDQPFTSTNLTTTQNQTGVSSYYTSGQGGLPTELAIYRTGRYVRVQLAGTNYLSIAEVQVFTGPSSPPIQWLISDHLGSPRMVLDQTGNLNSMKRHDYLPFGEELVAPTGGRSPAQGYAGGDGVRQQFTSQERDSETGFDYFQARYYSPVQGRFARPDEPFIDQEEWDPQSWGLYNYVRNNPLRFIDPFGDARWVTGPDDLQHYIGDHVGEYDKDLDAYWDGEKWEFNADVLPLDIIYAPTWRDRQKEALEMMGRGYILAKEAEYDGRIWVMLEIDKALSDPGVQFALNTIAIGKIAGKLRASANLRGNAGVTPAGRHFQKHLARGRSVTGIQTGSSALNAQQGAQLVDDILANPNATATIRSHPVHGQVLEVKVPGGTGARWTADGSRFLGFLEP